MLQDLLESVQAILGSHFVGMMLFGSLALGDFDQASDIDVLVVTDDDLSGDRFEALKAMHARINAREASWWDTQLEVSYIPQAALRRYDPDHALHPHMDRDRGERLHLMPHERDWVIQRHILREKGVALAGPAPQALIDPVTPDELRAAMRAVLPQRGEALLSDPAPLQTRGYQSFIVLSICRVLYTLQHGAVVSKRVAAGWAQATLGERWRGLIERAWAGRQSPRSKAQAEDVEGTLESIRYALEKLDEGDIGGGRVVRADPWKKS